MAQSWGLFLQNNNPRTFKLKRDISTLIQGSMTISTYFTTLNGHWDELAILTPTPKCTYGVLKELTYMQDIERVFQFFMGLHDFYASIRSQILVIDPLPLVTKVYLILHQKGKATPPSYLQCSNWSCYYGSSSSLFLLFW